MNESIYHLQPATADHQPAIKALIKRVQINPMGLDWRHFIVATDDAGILIGCGQIKQHRDGSQELASIAVLPEWRQQGVARSIIRRLLTDGPRPLWLTCIAPMTPFYEKFGFQRVTDLAAMMPHFRRISRFVRIWLRLAALLKRPRPFPDLAVMLLAE